MGVAVLVAAIRDRRVDKIRENVQDPVCPRFPELKKLRTILHQERKMQICGGLLRCSKDEAN